MKESDWLSAEEVRNRLGLRAQTLYAYVSRGRVQARPDPGDPRRSQYRAADVAALARRKARGRKASAVAAEAIAWGEPVLDSAITTVVDGRLWYRGRDAALLAVDHTFEAVARILRGGMGDPPPLRLRPPPPAGETMRERLFLALAAQAARSRPTLDRDPVELANEAAAILDLAADAVCGAAGSGAIHARLARAWSVGPRGADLIRRTLILVADHELNASTFAARVAASTGAGLGACVVAGLATLSGPRHGDLAAAVEGFIDAASREGQREAAGALRIHWTPAPGFGHPLYPDGDPRSRALLALFETPAPLAAVRDAVESQTGAHNNLDFALAALSRSLDLPTGASFALFAVARTAGWLAHAMEQATTGGLIRPRARYIGVAPEL